MFKFVPHSSQPDVLERLCDAILDPARTACLVVGPPASGRSLLVQSAAAATGSAVRRWTVDQPFEQLHNRKASIQTYFSAAAHTKEAAVPSRRPPTVVVVDDVDLAIAGLRGLHPALLAAIQELRDCGNPANVTYVMTARDACDCRAYRAFAKALDGQGLALAVLPPDRDSIVGALAELVPHCPVGTLAAFVDARDAHMPDIAHDFERFRSGLGVGRACGLLGDEAWAAASGASTRRAADSLGQRSSAAMRRVDAQIAGLRALAADARSGVDDGLGAVIAAALDAA